MVLSLHYFGNVYYYALILRNRKIQIDLKENYLKQTYRNRCTILGSNGPLNLVIPVVKASGQKQKMEEVCIAYDEGWREIHWKSITSAYRTSPYFEFFEPQFEELFNKKETFLKDFCLAAYRLTAELLNLKIPITYTEKYEPAISGETDYRLLLSPKKKEIPPVLIRSNYIQVFSDRFPFYPNLSILDLLFNEGPNTLHYLENIAKELSIED